MNNNHIPVGARHNTIIIGGGNMLSVTLPLAAYLRSADFAPVFATRRGGRYADVFSKRATVEVKLVSWDEEDVLARYELAAVSRPSFEFSGAAFPLAPLELLTAEDYGNVDMAFICVEPSALKSAFDDIAAQNSSRAVPLPVVLLANLSRGKDYALAANLPGITPIPAVIHRTSTGWRIDDSVIRIRTNDTGSLISANTALFHDVAAIAGGVTIKAVPIEEVIAAEREKFLTINLPDYIVAKIAETAAVEAKSRDCTIGELLTPQTRVQALNALRYIDLAVNGDSHAETPLRHETATVRLAQMERDCIDRILKTGHAYLDKLSFIREKCAALLPGAHDLNLTNADNGVAIGFEVISSILRLP
ncbi:hypothetical protein AGMMS49957_17450 [Synergistales bacterium]|nr:hypothetical protein AGMMS49957_17450 [Synergistales bacterium]